MVSDTFLQLYSLMKIIPRNIWKEAGVMWDSPLFPLVFEYPPLTNEKREQEQSGEGTLICSTGLTFCRLFLRKTFLRMKSLIWRKLYYKSYYAYIIYRIVGVIKYIIYQEKLYCIHSIWKWLIIDRLFVFSTE